MDYKEKFTHLMFQALMNDVFSNAEKLAKDLGETFIKSPKNFNFEAAYNQLLEACIEDIKAI